MQEGGPLEVNGHALNEPYIYAGNTPCDDEPFGPINVPKGNIWVMGDHRQNSLDSRYHQELADHGTFPADKVVGRAVVVAWPVNRWSTLPVPTPSTSPGSVPSPRRSRVRRPWRPVPSVCAGAAAYQCCGAAR